MLYNQPVAGVGGSSVGSAWTGQVLEDTGVIVGNGHIRSGSIGRPLVGWFLSGRRVASGR